MSSVDAHSIVDSLHKFGLSNNLSDEDLLFVAASFIAEKESGEYKGKFSSFLFGIDDNHQQEKTDTVPTVKSNDVWIPIQDPSPPPGFSERLVLHLDTAPHKEAVKLLEKKLDPTKVGHTYLIWSAAFRSKKVFSLSVVEGSTKIYVEPELNDKGGIVDALPSRTTIPGKYEFQDEKGSRYLVDVKLSNET